MHTAHAEYVSALLAAGKSAAEVDTEMADIAGARCMAYLPLFAMCFHNRMLRAGVTVFIKLICSLVVDKTARADRLWGNRFDEINLLARRGQSRSS